MVSLQDNPLFNLGVLEILTAGCMPDVIGMCSGGYRRDGLSVFTDSVLSENAMMVLG